MTQHNPILEALALLPHEEQERILADALSTATVEELERVLLQLPLQEVSSNTKARVAFRMGMTPLGHTEFNGGNARDWVLPSLAGPLRLSLYDLSRLASAIQVATTNLASGKGDYGSLYLLLAPAKLDELAANIRTIIQNYTTHLRDAGRRPRSNTSGRGRNNAPPAGDSRRAHDVQRPPLSAQALPVPASHEEDSEESEPAVTAEQAAHSSKTATASDDTASDEEEGDEAA